MSREKNPTSLSLSKKAIDYLDTQDNKSLVPNLLFEALADSQTDLKYIQSRLHKVDYKEIINAGIEKLVLEASRVKPLSLGDLGGESIPGTVPPTDNSVSKIMEFIKANRPNNISIVKEAFPTVVINEELFAKGKPSAQNGHYTNEFFNSIGVIQLPNGGLDYV